MKILIALSLITMPSYAIFKLGIENIPTALIKEWKKYNIALVTNQTGTDQSGKKNIEIFAEKGIRIKSLFAPEHGIHGLEQAGSTIINTKDHTLQIPIFSLYAHGEGKKIGSSLLQNIDILFFDIQDSGMRYFTYISTLYQVLEAAAEHNKKIVVFDRPNPLGIVMEGPLVDPTHVSFVSIAEIPLRHGMTMGELADYFNTYILKKKANLTVISMQNYERTDSISTLHAPLSPNIPHATACFGYSFLGLLGEIRPFNVGVGTEHAFQLIALPASLQVADTTWHSIAAELKKHGVETVPHNAFDPRKKKYFTGLKITIANINQVAGFKALLTIVTHIKKIGVPLEFSNLFDKAAGSPKLRNYLTGTLSHQELTQDINTRLQQFFPKAQSVLKYLPEPRVHFI